MAGGIAGAAYWTAFYPADTVKSVMQTDSSRTARGFGGVFVDLFREGGIRALYRVRSERIIVEEQVNGLIISSLFIVAFFFVVVVVVVVVVCMCVCVSKL